MEREDFDYDPNNPKLREGAALLLKGTLMEKGFETVRLPDLIPRGTKEVIMDFRVLGSTKHVVRVYTSFVPLGSRSVTFRAEGKDAIRVVPIVVFGGKDGRLRFKTIGSTKRVNRTGTVWGIVDRTLERAREAYRIAREDLRTPPPWMR